MSPSKRRSSACASFWVPDARPYWQNFVCWLQVPWVHVLLLQQRRPGVPHCVQVVFCPQTRLPALHVSFAQHVWPGPPHTAQTLLSPQPSPPPQIWPAQHACPAPPHAPQTLLEQPRFGPHVSLAQHACPAPPHPVHVPFVQRVEPAVQLLFGQHG